MYVRIDSEHSSLAPEGYWGCIWLCVHVFVYIFVQVIEKKCGIPISLSTVYQSVAHRMGVRLLPVSAPFNILLCCFVSQKYKIYANVMYVTCKHVLVQMTWPGRFFYTKVTQSVTVHFMYALTAIILACLYCAGELSCTLSLKSSSDDDRVCCEQVWTVVLFVRMSMCAPLHKFNTCYCVVLMYAYCWPTFISMLLFQEWVSRCVYTVHAACSSYKNWSGHDWIFNLVYIRA